MKRNGLAERDRCIIERLSRNHIITPPVLNMLTTWRDLAINRHEENLGELNTRRIAGASGNLPPSISGWWTERGWQDGRY